MNCEWVNQQATLFVFEELGDADRIEVEQHLHRCAECSRVVEAERQLRRLMDLRPKLEAGPALLAECRVALSEALEDEPAPAQAAPGHSGWPWLEWLRAPFSGMRLQWQAGMAAALLSVGFLTGAFVNSRTPAAPAPGGEPEVSAANVSNIHAITPRPDGTLDISLATTRRRVISGKVDDPRIQELLVLAVSQMPNSGLRLDSIELLKGRSQDEQIRAALVGALRNDRNSGVRLKAIESLRGFASDAGVRSALMEVLLTDQNPGVRIAAIDLLAAQQDTLAIRTLQRLAETDPNTFIRLKSRKTLREWNAPEETY
jgi:hypothetical protein